MIARIWRGTTLQSQADIYLDYMAATGLRDYRRADGNRGIFALRRQRGEQADFLLLTLWDSIDAIRRFAGPQLERARYYPRDADYLLRLEPEAEHYELAWFSSPPAGRLAADPLRLPLELVRHL